jgi:hypothetical protein
LLFLGLILLIAADVILACATSPIVVLVGTAL